MLDLLKHPLTDGVEYFHPVSGTIFIPWSKPRGARFIAFTVVGGGGGGSGGATGAVGTARRGGSGGGSGGGFRGRDPGGGFRGLCGFLGIGRRLGLPRGLDVAAKARQLLVARVEELYDAELARFVEVLDGVAVPREQSRALRSVAEAVRVAR